LPRFGSEEEEILFWDTHHPADYFTEPAPDVVIKLKRDRSGKLPPVTICPSPRYR
jgi:hypothetical protein